MIVHLSGTLFFANDHYVVVDINGVGYKVRTSLNILHTLKKELDNAVSLWIHTVVREDVLDLYGFLNKEELDFFELLIGVSGIGPKSALGILNISSVASLKEAIVNGNAVTLTKVSGIGAKNAQKIILELRDKLGSIGDEKYGGNIHEEHDAIDGLIALGFSERDAREALKNVSPDIKGPSARIKHALKHLGK